MFINQIVNVKVFGSSALQKIGRRWTVVALNNDGQYGVNEVGGDGHRVRPTGYRRVRGVGSDANFEFLNGTQFVVAKGTPCGDPDVVAIQITVVGSGSLTAPLPQGYGYGSAQTTPTPKKVTTSTVYHDGKAFKVTIEG